MCSMDKEYKIEFFPKWLLWTIKFIPYVIVLILFIAVIIERGQPSEIVYKEVIVHEEVECDTIHDITSMMHRNDTRIFSVKRLSNHSFEVFTQSKNGHITRVIHSWE